MWFGVCFEKYSPYRPVCQVKYRKRHLRGEKASVPNTSGTCGCRSPSSWSFCTGRTSAQTSAKNSTCPVWRARRPRGKRFFRRSRKDKSSTRPRSTRKRTWAPGPLLCAARRPTCLFFPSYIRLKYKINCVCVCVCGWVCVCESKHGNYISSLLHREHKAKNFTTSRKTRDEIPKIVCLKVFSCNADYCYFYYNYFLFCFHRLLYA